MNKQKKNKLRIQFNKENNKIRNFIKIYHKHFKLSNLNIIKCSKRNNKSKQKKNMSTAI